MLPVLSRGLSDPVQEVLRTCCLIVANMYKIVEVPAAIMPIKSKSEPLVCTCKSESFVSWSTYRGQFEVGVSRENNSLETDRYVAASCWLRPIARLRHLHQYGEFCFL